MAKAISKKVSGVLTTMAEAAPGLVIDFGDDTQASVLLADLPPDVVTRLAVHGLSQKVGDSYAGAAKAEGMTPLAYAKEAVRETIEQLLAGQWRVSAGPGEPRVTQLARAVARAFGITVEAATATIREREEALDEESYKAFLKATKADNAVKKALAEIKAEDAIEAANKVAAPSGESAIKGLFGA